MSTQDHVPHSEFCDFRTEMREHMQQQTVLMRQMVELQTKHSHLEFQLSKVETKMDNLESRLRPIEVSQGSNSERIRSNKDLGWFLLTIVVGVGAFAVKALIDS